MRELAKYEQKADKLINTIQCWQNMAIAGEYKALVDATATVTDESQIIVTALWHARALRALSRGDAANSALLNAAESKFSAKSTEVAELAEELIQSGYYETAADLAEKLRQAGTPQGDYIWTILWRERGEWSKFQESYIALAGHGAFWKSLSIMQQVWALLQQQQIERASKLFEPFKTEAHPAIQKLLARLDIAQGNFDDARVRLEQLALRQPLDWEWPCLLAAALIRDAIITHATGNNSVTEHVHNLFENGLKRQPRQPEALYNRARFKYSLNDASGAEVDCNAALAIKPWFDEPLLFWVEHAAAERDYDRATLIIENARKIVDTPRRAGAVLDLMRFTGEKNDKIINTVDTMLKRFSYDSIFLRTAGAALQAAKKPDRAALLYERALQITPDDISTRNNLAMLYKERGDFEEAVVALRMIKSDNNETVRLNLAHILLRRGDLAEAEEIFRSILSINTKQPSALRGMAELKYAAMDDDAAWDFAMQSVKVDAKNPLAWKTAAGIAIRREGTEAMIRLLAQGEKNAMPVLPIRQALFQNLRYIINLNDLKQKVAEWCDDDPGEVEYLLMAADAAHDANDFSACEELLKKSLEYEISIGSTALIRYYEGRERYGAARRVAEQLVRTDPQTMKHWGLLAEVLYRQERVEEALKTLDIGLKREPTRLSLVRQKVGILLATERFAEAIAAARSLFEQDAGPLQLALFTEALTRSQSFDEAVAIVEKCLVANERDRILRLQYASTLYRAGRYDDALQALEFLYRDEPDNFAVVRRYVGALAFADKLSEAVLVLGLYAEKNNDRPDITAAVCELLREEGAKTEARELLISALELAPKHLDLWLQLAETEKRNGDVAAETKVWQEVIKRFAPRRWVGIAIQALVRLDLVVEMEQALNDWRKAEPKNPAPWWMAFIAAKEMKNNNMALGMLNKIERLRGLNARVYSERASVFSEIWQLTAAIEQTRKAIDLQPSSVTLYEQLLNIQVKAGDFEEFETLMGKINHLHGDLRYGRYANYFFNINCHPTWSAAEIWRFYHDWYERSVKPFLPPPKPQLNVRDPERKLRIGYVSPDFRRHAVAYFTEPLLIEHDREQFELFAYAHLEPKEADQYTERFKSYFHHWTEIRGMSDNELERRIRRDGIDILIDLAGHTANSRLSIFVRRPAPIQVTGIFGAGQTSGLPQIDYLLSDSHFIPPEHAPFLAEKLWRLPRAGMPYIPPNDGFDPVPLPCLEQGFVTFGVLTRPLRANRPTVAVWAEILKRVPGSRLRFDHLPYVEPDVQQRLIGHFAEHGVTAEQIIFLNTRPHWLVYQQIDLQLDPFPACSGTTAVEGMYMERLVMTMQGRPPLGRGTYVMQMALGLDDICSARSPEEYIDKTVALALDHARLAELSAGLRRRMQDSWLMDYKGFGRDVAEAYRQMWREWCGRVE